MSDWQPIATAPWGVDVVLCIPNWQDRIVIAHRFPGDDDSDCWYPQDESQFRGEPYREISPSHWMPLPEPPR